MLVFFLFLLALTAGTLSTLFWIPERDMGRGYFQMNALVVLGLLGLAGAVLLLHPFRPFGELAGPGGGLLGAALVGGFAYYAAIWKERWMMARGLAAWTLGATAGALLLAGLQSLPERAPLPGRSFLVVGGLIAAALLLGWSLVAMLLGHWYLIAPRLTFRHLTTFCRVLVATVVVRVLAEGASLAAAARVDPLLEPNPWRALTSLGAEGIFFWFRLLWGLLMPLVLALMALRCAEQRSNQSATGILYVLLVGTFIGEITGLYLSVTTGIPV